MIERNCKRRAIVDVVTNVNQTNAMHTMAWWLGGSMFQEVEQAESSTFATLGPYPPPTSSLRIKITATIIREEAAESLLVDIQEEAELVALACVLNRYDAQWWVQHLCLVGADPVSYWRGQLGEEIKAATRSKNYSPPLKRDFWYFFSCSTIKAKYDLVDLDLDPL